MALFLGHWSCSSSACYLTYTHGISICNKWWEFACVRCQLPSCFGKRVSIHPLSHTNSCSTGGSPLASVVSKRGSSPLSLSPWSPLVDGDGGALHDTADAPSKNPSEQPPVATGSAPGLLLSGEDLQVR